MEGGELDTFARRKGCYRLIYLAISRWFSSGHQPDTIAHIAQLNYVVRYLGGPLKPNACE
jgi:hypothetical protein